MVLGVAAMLFGVLFTTIATKQSTFAKTNGQAMESDANTSVAGSTLAVIATNRANSHASNILLPLVARSSEPALLTIFGFSFLALALLLRFRSPVSSSVGTTTSSSDASTSQA
jgi:hypothetical protein